MTYTNVSHIKSVKDVKAFFHYLVDERKLNFHTDEDFIDYVYYEDKAPSFTEEEVSVYNRLREEYFDVCEKADVDMFETGHAILRPTIGFSILK